MNPWEEEKIDGASFGGVFGSSAERSSDVPGDGYGTTDSGLMDATAVQNGSHTGPHLNDRELAMLQDRINQMVANGVDPASIPSQCPGVDQNLVRQMVERAETQQNFNPFDNTPGGRQQGAPQEQQGERGFLGGLMAGLTGAGSVISDKLGTARDSVASLGQRLFQSGVEKDPRNISLAELGNLVPNVQVGKGRSQDGPMVG